MNKEVISDNQAMSIIILFIFGESSIMISGLVAKQDIWVSIILAMFISIPLAFIYGRIFNVFHEKNLFETIEICFGKIIGKIIIISYIWYFLDTAALVLRNFGQFVNIVSLTSTPMFVPMLGIMLICCYVVSKGIEVIGRCGKIIIIVPAFLIILVTILLVPDMHFDNIKPIMANGISPILNGTYQLFIYPFGETVIFIAAFANFQSKKSIYKIYLKSFIIGGLFVLIISLSIVFTLGINYVTISYYPAYETVSRINIGNILQRVEILSSIVFLLGVFIKISIYLLSTCKGISRLFKCKDYRFIAFPVSLLILNIAIFDFDSVMSFNEWIFNVWIYYAFLFMILIPVITLIIAEIKIRRKKHIPS